MKHPGILIPPNGVVYELDCLCRCQFVYRPHDDVPQYGFPTVEPTGGSMARCRESRWIYYVIRTWSVL